MTFSLIARCNRTGQMGVAAATGAMAVGKLVSYACARTGAAATQAFVNPYLGIDTIKLLSKGASAPDALAAVLREDPEPHKRQLAVIDCTGHTAVHSGQSIAHWAGHRTFDGMSVQGNRLAGPQVLDAAIEAYERHRDEDLAHRLLLALEAGDAQGGDHKGEQSATLLVYDTEEYPLWDVRVDQNEQPVRELRRLFDLFERELLPLMKKLPTRAEGHDGFEMNSGGLA